MKVEQWVKSVQGFLSHILLYLVGFIPYQHLTALGQQVAGSSFLPE